MINFSVIIPTYNRDKTLKRAIESVLHQDYSFFELIVVDDGSTDNTTELLREFPQVKVVRTENYGVSHARNCGVREAKYPWICFLDSDDEWLTYKLQKQADYIIANEGIKIIHGEELWIRNGVRVNPKRKHRKGGGDQFYTSLKLCAISPSTVCLHRDLLDEFNGFNNDFVVCEDYELWLKITHKYPVGFIEDVLIKKYGGHADQLSHKYKAMDYYRIKAMAQLASEYNLPDNQLKALKQELASKGKILLNGFRKHDNMKNYSEVEQLVTWAIA